ncbi:FG-GAP repeat domain-containing protein [Gemmobacter caeruleus]|uniref:FG-GAP repeat domain-containing protein n=1 Tax=Gemmobacter caeruleus TaxID=2595004 RepID=UPI001EEFC4BB|nr:VCBS repeat-containing protein [Gemmobacter caeruleus]
MAETLVAARYAEPVARYDHHILGRLRDHGALVLTLRACGDCAPEERRFRLPETHVFEDVAPRLWDVTGDGAPEAVVVETDIARGAALAIYGPAGRLAATAPIGQTHRWLAPAGAGDFDGDGRIEIAYVDRPHLRRELVFLRLDGPQLTEVARLPGYANHRIGEERILSGSRDCGAGAELVLPDATGRLVALRLDMPPRPLNQPATDAGLARALACAN